MAHLSEAHLPLKTGQDNGDEEVKPHLQASRSPWVSKKREGCSFRTLMNSEAKTASLWKQYEGHFGEALDLPLLPGVRTNLQKDRIKIATMPDTEKVCRATQNPHHTALGTQGTLNFCSGIPPTGLSNNPQTAWISRYQGFVPMASPLLQKIKAPWAIWKYLFLRR